MDTDYDLSWTEEQEEVDFQDLLDEREPDTELCWDRNYLFEMNCDLDPGHKGQHQTRVNGVTFRWR